MNEATRLTYLQRALRVFGLIAIFGVVPLTIVWPSGWVWQPGRSEYLEMIVGVYATLGVFLLIAARDPRQHLSLISFALWSSVVHGAVMAVQALVNPQHMPHLYGDVLALFVIAAVLAVLSPDAFRLRFAQPVAEPVIPADA